MWRRYAPLWLVLGAQLLVLALVPARVVYARLFGTDVTLRTVPVDPYDLLSGYYVTLAYEVEQPPNGVDHPTESYDERVYIVVRRGEPAWDRVRFAATAEGLGPDEVALRARWRGVGAALDGAGRFYIPEDRRLDVERALAEVGGRALVDLRVGPDGTIALLRLRAAGESFGED